MFFRKKLRVFQVFKNLNKLFIKIVNCDLYKSTNVSNSVMLLIFAQRAQFNSHSRKCRSLETFFKLSHGFISGSSLTLARKLYFYWLKFLVYKIPLICWNCNNFMWQSLFKNTWIFIMFTYSIKLLFYFFCFVKFQNLKRQLKLQSFKVKKIFFKYLRKFLR